MAKVIASTPPTMKRAIVRPLFQAKSVPPKLIAMINEVIDAVIKIDPT